MIQSDPLIRLVVFTELYYWNPRPLLRFHLQIIFCELQNACEFSWMPHCLGSENELKREVRKESKWDMLGPGHITLVSIKKVLCKTTHLGRRMKVRAWEKTKGNKYIKLGR